MIMDNGGIEWPVHSFSEGDKCYYCTQKNGMEYEDKAKVRSIALHNEK